MINMEGMGWKTEAVRPFFYRLLGTANLLYLLEGIGGIVWYSVV